MVTTVRDERLKRKARTRYSIKVANSSARPRLSVFRSHQHICAQLILDSEQKTLASASTLQKEVKAQLGKKKLLSYGNKTCATLIGKTIAQLALKLGVKTVVFDRGGYAYHGAVKNLAEAARAAGLSF